MKAKKGHVDIVFANAGYGDLSPLGSITPEAYESSFNLNVRGVLFVVQAALPLFRDGGSIIISGAIAGAKGIPGFTVYGAAKATLRSFARTWTQELKERRIRTNILSPGPVLTPVDRDGPERGHRSDRRGRPARAHRVSRGDRQRGAVPRVGRGQLRHRRRAVRRRRHPAGVSMSRLFEPLAIGALTLPNRIVTAPMTRNRSSGTGRRPTR